MKTIAHESAKLHVTGKAVYTDDILTSANALIGKVFFSQTACATINSYDLTKALQIPGVVAILTSNEIPGINNFGPVYHDELILAEKNIDHAGQAIFLIAAENEEIAFKASQKIKLELTEHQAILNIEQAIAVNNLLHPERIIERGNIEKAFSECQHIIEDSLQTGAQEHWYLETQVCLAIPLENEALKVYSSTQNPAETQTLIAEALNISRNQVEVEVPRIGGGFGGKETQGNHVAIWTSILANATKRPVKIRLNRNEDQTITGKRHPFLVKYKVGFNEEGKILAATIEIHSNAGSSSDLSMAILERAMLHAENSYFIPNIRISGKAWKTNLPSNTAFRGFGGPQAIAAMEKIIEQIAFSLKKDALEIRYKNFYGISENNVTPYSQLIEENKLQIICSKILDSSSYYQRKEEIKQFNAKNEFFKKGIAISPVKFGISFTTSFLNQAGALIHIYKDGTILANHSGTEMGQGIHTKMLQIVAQEFGLDFGKVKIKSTNTSFVPNTSPTAASSGTDLNGMAILEAIQKLKTRIRNAVVYDFEKNHKTIINPENLVFHNNYIFDSSNPEVNISFEKAIMVCFFNQVSLSATGYYRVPDIFFNRNEGKGKPFHYFTFGMAVTEILLDVLTGNVTILRTDILQDVGNSINRNIDKGKIEGGYIQGVGWILTEDCKWNEKGQLLNYSPDTYKIPTANDIPEIFNIAFLEDSPNPKAIYQSKAIGEPPFMLAISCWLAVKDAISSITNYTVEPNLPIPATNNTIVNIIEKLK